MRQKSSTVLAVAILCSFAQIFWSLPLAANAASVNSVCDSAAQSAAQDTDVPLAVLLSISRVESGRTHGGDFSPWPWTVNLAGRGHFFDSADEAIAFSAAQLDEGNANFDVGCFQINLRWHSKGFSSLQNAFDPMSNAAYAATFLTQLYQEMGNWADAVSAYHSRTPKYAETYLAKVKSTWQDMRNAPSLDAASIQDPPTPVQPMQDQPENRINNFPLLQAGVGVNGSLVPQDNASGVRFRLW